MVKHYFKKEKETLYPDKKTIDFIVKRILKNNLQKINYKDSTLIIDIKDISSQLRISNFTLNKDNLSVVLIYSFGQSIFS